LVKKAGKWGVTKAKSRYVNLEKDFAKKLGRAKYTMP